MKIRKRQGKSGESWQVDLGICEGRRKQYSFKTYGAARAFLADAQRHGKEVGSQRLRSLVSESPATVEGLTTRLGVAEEEVLRLRAEVDRLKMEREILTARVGVLNLPSGLAEIAGLVQGMVMPKNSGVYFLVSGDEVVYVGQAVSVLRRLHDHAHRLGKAFDSAYWLDVPRADLADVERVWIERLRPRYNVAGV